MGRIMGKQKRTTTKPPLWKTDDTYAFDDHEKATALNGMSMFF